MAEPATPANPEIIGLTVNRNALKTSIERLKAMNSDPHEATIREESIKLADIEKRLTAIDPVQFPAES